MAIFPIRQAYVAHIISCMYGSHHNHIVFLIFCRSTSLRSRLLSFMQTQLLHLSVSDPAASFPKYDAQKGAA